MAVGHAPRIEKLFQRIREFQHRLARGQVLYPHAVPVGRRVDAGAERLGERFLGREALGEVVGSLLVHRESLQFGRTEDSLRQSITESGQRLLHSPHFDDIGPHAVDHRAASTIRRFISRTASRMPTNSDRLTMAWPMCGSRTPGRRATGWTLK